MNDSTKRALRTAFQTLVGLLASLPVLLASVPVGAQVATIVAAVAIVTKVLNALEDAGLIPAWLKTTPKA